MDSHSLSPGKDGWRLLEKNGGEQKEDTAAKHCQLCNLPSAEHRKTEPPPAAERAKGANGFLFLFPISPQNLSHAREFFEQNEMFTPSLDGGQVAKECQMTAERSEGY